MYIQLQINLKLFKIEIEDTEDKSKKNINFTK